MAYYIAYTYSILDAAVTRTISRAIHQSRPAFQVMSTNPLRAKEATVCFQLEIF
jgi:hypothetical protein